MIKVIDVLREGEAERALNEMSGDGWRLLTAVPRPSGSVWLIVERADAVAQAREVERMATVPPRHPLPASQQPQEKGKRAGATVFRAGKEGVTKEDL